MRLAILLFPLLLSAQTFPSALRLPAGFRRPGVGIAPPAGIQIPHSIGYSSPTNSGNVSASPILTTSAGDDLLIGIFYYSTPGGVPLIPSLVQLSDGSTNCAQDTGGLDQLNGNTSWWYSCHGIPSGITGFTVQQSSTGFVTIVGLDVSGLVHGFDHGTNTLGSTTPSTTWATNPVTPTSGVQALIVGFGVGNLTHVMAATSPYSTYAQAAVGFAVAVAAQVVAVTSGAYTPNGTNASAQANTNSLGASYR